MSAGCKWAFETKVFALAMLTILTRLYLCFSFEPTLLTQSSLRAEEPARRLNPVDILEGLHYEIGQLPVRTWTLSYLRNKRYRIFGREEGTLHNALPLTPSFHYLPSPQFSPGQIGESSNSRGNGCYAVTMSRIFLLVFMNILFLIERNTTHIRFKFFYSAVLVNSIETETGIGDEALQRFGGWWWGILNLHAFSFSVTFPIQDCFSVRCRAWNFFLDDKDI